MPEGRVECVDIVKEAPTDLIRCLLSVCGANTSLLSSDSKMLLRSQNVPVSRQNCYPHIPYRPIDPCIGNVGLLVCYKTGQKATLSHDFSSSFCRSSTFWSKPGFNSDSTVLQSGEATSQSNHHQNDCISLQRAESKQALRIN